MNACELCRRTVPHLTRHHLIPQTRHKNKKNKKLFTRAEVISGVAMLCGACHKNIHAHLTEKELERDYNTLESLATHSGIAAFTTWVQRQPPETAVRVRASREKRSR